MKKLESALRKVKKFLEITAMSDIPPFLHVPLKLKKKKKKDLEDILKKIKLITAKLPGKRGKK